MKTMTTAVLTLFLFMTGMWILCNLPLLWKIPSAWKDRKLVALDGQRDTDLWLWTLSAAVSVAVGLRFFGHYYMQLIPPLALLAAGALSRGSAVWAKRAVAFALVVGVRVLGRRLLLPSARAGAELRVGVALPRHHHQPRRPDLRVGQRARDLLGVGPSPRHALPHASRSSPATTRVDRRRTPTPAPTPRRRGRTSTPTSPRTHRSTSSTRHRRRCAARSTTRSPTSRASSTSSTPSTSTSSPSTASTSTSASSRLALERCWPGPDGRSDERPGGAVPVAGEGQAPGEEHLGATVEGVELVRVEQRREAVVEGPSWSSASTRHTSSAASGGIGSPAKSQMTVRSFHSSWNETPWSMPKMHVVGQRRAGSGRPCGRCC